MAKYNIEEFKNWLNEDESRKEGIKDWEKLFWNFENRKDWIIWLMKSGCNEVEGDNFDDFTIFFNLIETWYRSGGKEEGAWYATNVLFKWFNEKIEQEKNEKVEEKIEVFPK